MSQKEKHTYELTNEEGQIIWIRTSDISMLPVAFGSEDEEVSDVVHVIRIE